MKTINEVFISHLDMITKNVLCKRDGEEVRKRFNVQVKGSDNITLSPHIQDITLIKVDDTHDKVIIPFEDYTLNGVIEWQKSNNDLYRFVKIVPCE